jgi:hypothetical protein
VQEARPSGFRVPPAAAPRTTKRMERLPYCEAAA